MRDDFGATNLSDNLIVAPRELLHWTTVARALTVTLMTL